MKIQHENLIQIVESYLNIILNQTDEKEYADFIESNSKLKQYDDLMDNDKEKDIPYKLIEEVYVIVKEKVKLLDKLES